ncbi:MAG: hypothetical protein U9O06_01840 [Euryarchaeota archaeon]|nr:hypothetical protein [Euryarchaeota archaeon]
MTRPFSSRLVGVAIVGAVLSLSRLWVPGLFGLLGDVRWGGGFLIIASIEIAADLAAVLAAVGVGTHVITQSDGFRSTGILVQLALISACGVIVSVGLLRIAPYRLLAPVYPVLYFVRTGGLVVLLGTSIGNRFQHRDTTGGNPRAVNE